MVIYDGVKQDVASIENVVGDADLTSTGGTLSIVGNPAAKTINLDVVAGGGAVDASSTQKGVTKLSVNPASATNPIAVGVNDPAYLDVTDGGDSTSHTHDDLAAVGGFTGANGTFRPSADDTIDLGDSATSRRWRNLYLGTGAVDSSGDMNLTAGGSSIVANKQVRPISTNAHDLGTSTRRWKDIHVAGQIAHAGTTAPQIFGTGAATFEVRGSVADGASAVGISLDTANALSTAGAKLLSVRNATTEKWAVDKDGFAVSPGAKPSASFTVTLPNAGAAATREFIVESNQQDDAAARLFTLRLNTQQTAAAATFAEMKNGTSVAFAWGRSSSIEFVAIGGIANAWISSGFFGPAQSFVALDYTAAGTAAQFKTTSTTTPWAATAPVTDGASAVAFDFNCTVTLANATALHTRGRNNGSVIWAHDKDGKLQIGGVQVVQTRITGWGAPTGTLDRTALASYAGQNVSAIYVEAEAQATDDAVKKVSQELAALLTDLRTHGLIGT